MIKIRPIEFWQSRGCSACNSKDNGEELIIGKNGNSVVLTLCKECKTELKRAL